MEPSDDASWDLAPTATYVEGLRRGELLFLRCDACQRASFYPRVLCPHCGSTSLQWQRSSGDGVVYSVTEVFPKDADPYNICLVDVVEGFRMATTVLGSRPSIGDGVRFDPDASLGDEPRPVFAAAGEAT
jgi:uncharacterized OB-fold protein